MTYPLMPDQYVTDDWSVDDSDRYTPDGTGDLCDGFGCIVPESGMHHDKINGPHYWCVECEGCERCDLER